MQIAPSIMEKDRRRTMPIDFWGLFLLPFIIGIMTVSYIPGLSKVMILYGFVLSGCYMLYFLYNRQGLQPEVLIYFAWITWSLGGLLNVIDSDNYVQQMQTIIQIGVLIFIIAGITAMRRDISLVVLAMGLGALIGGLASIYTGEFQQKAGAENFRAAGLTGNANEFAYCLLFVIFAVLYFWNKRSSLWWKSLLAAVAAFSGVFIVLSGSRKGIVGVLIFAFLWWFFCKEKKLSRNPIWIYLIVVSLLAGIFVSANYIMSRTYLGQRLEELDDSSDQKRIQMYKEGLDMIKKHPVFGVGLDNYRVLSSTGLYSHSDYIEVAANTGVVGFTLYFSIYAVLWLRLGRIRRLIRDPQILYACGFIRACILTILAIGFGRPNITSKLTWIFLAGAIGYSWSIESAIKRMRVNRLLSPNRK